MTPAGVTRSSPARSAAAKSASDQPLPGQQSLRRHPVQAAHPQLRQARQAGARWLVPRRSQHRGPAPDHGPDAASLSPELRLGLVR